MPLACRVPGCRKNTRTHPRHTFFRNPQDPKLRAKWLAFAGVEEVAGEIRICIDHFDPKCIYKRHPRCLLARGSVPTIKPRASTSTNESVTLIGNMALEPSATGENDFQVSEPSTRAENNFQVSEEVARNLPSQNMNAYVTMDSNVKPTEPRLGNAEAPAFCKFSDWNEIVLGWKQMVSQSRASGFIAILNNLQTIIHIGNAMFFEDNVDQDLLIRAYKLRPANERQASYREYDENNWVEFTGGQPFRLGSPLLRRKQRPIGSVAFQEIIIPGDASAVAISLRYGSQTAIVAVRAAVFQEDQWTTLLEKGSDIGPDGNLNMQGCICSQQIISWLQLSHTLATDGCSSMDEVVQMTKRIKELRGRKMVDPLPGEQDVLNEGHSFLQVTQ